MLVSIAYTAINQITSALHAMGIVRDRACETELESASSWVTYLPSNKVRDPVEYEKYIVTMINHFITVAIDGLKQEGSHTFSVAISLRKLLANSSDILQCTIFI